MLHHIPMITSSGQCIWYSGVIRYHHHGTLFIPSQAETQPIAISQRLRTHQDLIHDETYTNR